MHCYAPKHKAHLKHEDVLKWAKELDVAGALGVGFGGGEPTLHPDFLYLCEAINQETALAVSFTTHGHQLDKKLVDKLSSVISFARLSMDGCDATYELIRGRKFHDFIQKLEMLAGKVRYGINFVVNDDTVNDLSKLDFLGDLGCEEILLLPQHKTDVVADISSRAKMKMQSWVENYSGTMKLSISSYATEGIPICDIFSEDEWHESYAHIDADGILKRSSYSDQGVKIGKSVMKSLKKLKSISDENME